MRRFAGFVRFAAPGLRGNARKERIPAVAAAVAALDAGTARILKDRPKIRAGISDGLFVKRYNFPTLWGRFRHLFRKPRPLTVLEAVHAVAGTGVSTPPVVAWGRKRRYLLPEADYLLTEALPPETRFVNHALEKANPSDEAIISGVTALAARLHRAGIEHGDLSFRNLFIAPEGRFGVIDLDGCRLWQRAVPRCRRRRELARLISSFLLYRRELELLETAVRFCSAYREVAGIELWNEALPRRVNFLLRRAFTKAKRKDA